MRNLIRVLYRFVIIYIALSLLLSMFVSAGFARWPLLEHRAPFVVVDIAVSKLDAIRDDGTPEGTDQHGEYIAFSPRSNIGECFLTVFVWNPFTNACDDIAARLDFAL